MPKRRLEREALRLYDRYAEEVVEAFGLCPWAAAARRHGRVERRVLLIEHATPAPVAAIIEELAAGAADIALVLLPRLALDAGNFRRFVSELEQMHACAHPLGKSTVAMAAFHPRATLDTTTSARLVAYLRRSPDPTVQLVKRESLLHARRMADEGSRYATARETLATLRAPPQPLSVSETIAEQNLQTVLEHGARLAAVLESIERDRNESYAACLAAPRRMYPGGQ